MTSIPIHKAQEQDKISNIECPVARSIASMVRDRASKGMKTYGQTCADNNKPVIEWINDSIEELLDACIYLERLKLDLKRLGINNGEK